jgi:hypothetical protein
LFIQKYDKIKALKTKVCLWATQLEKENVIKFRTFQEYRDSHEGSENKQASKIESLWREFEGRFKDLKSCEEDFCLFTATFSFAAVNSQMEFDELQSDSVLKEKYKRFGIPEFHFPVILLTCATLRSKHCLRLVAHNFANHCSRS